LAIRTSYILSHALLLSQRFDDLTINCWSKYAAAYSFFFTNSLERFRIGFLIDKSPVLRISLNPAVIRWVIGLRASLNRAVSMPVTCWWISSHDFFLLKIAMRLADEMSDVQTGFPISRAYLLMPTKIGFSPFPLELFSCIVANTLTGTAVGIGKVLGSKVVGKMDPS
jgi:hypothetical protein